MKILISGGGKCNVTHAGPIEDVRAHFRVNEGRFLRPSFYRFTNDDFVLRMLTDKGMEVYTRPDGRIFPVPPQDAKDGGRRGSAPARCGRTCSSECSRGGSRHGERRDKRRHAHRQGQPRDAAPNRGGGRLVVSGDRHDRRRLALDGRARSYERPAARRAGPTVLEPTPPAEWSGIALRDCVLRARSVGENGSPGKERMRWRGDLLWTHKGVSGPTALGVSREVAEGDTGAQHRRSGCRARRAF